MVASISSDQLFLIFMSSLVISVLFITSGVGVVLPQRYNNRYRKEQRDKYHHNIINMFIKNRSEMNKKPVIWNYVLSLSLVITVLTFLLFIGKEFIL